MNKIIIILIIILYFINTITVSSSSSSSEVVYSTFDIKIKKCLSKVYDVQLDECVQSTSICKSGSFIITQNNDNNLSGQFNLNIYDDNNDCSNLNKSPTILMFDCNVVSNTNITDYGVFNVNCYSNNNNNNNINNNNNNQLSPATIESLSNSSQSSTSSTVSLIILSILSLIVFLL